MIMSPKLLKSYKNVRNDNAVRIDLLNDCDKKIINETKHVCIN